MPRRREKTDAKKSFEENVRRARYFLQIHEKMHGKQGAPEKALRELSRGAIVFAIGALDAYLSELSAEIISRQLSQGIATSESADKILQNIIKETPLLALKTSLLLDEQERMDYLRRAINEHLTTKLSHHGTKGISAVVDRLNISGRSSAFWNDVNRSFKKTKVYSKLEKVRRKYLKKDKSEELLLQKDIDHWTEIRHKIIHKGQKISVRREEAYSLIEIVAYIASHLDKKALQTLR